MEVLKKLNWANAVQLLSILLLIRALIDFSLGQAFLSAVVFGFFGFKAFLKHKEEKELSEQIKVLQEAIKDVDILKKELNDLRTNLSGLMIKNASKPSEMRQALENQRFF